MGGGCYIFAMDNDIKWGGGVVQAAALGHEELETLAACNEA